MRLNHGMPVWHSSISITSPRGGRLHAPRVAERAAVLLLAGVGGDVEWWLWNDEVRVGHLRVALTVAECAELPPGCAAFDAGPSGPRRRRTRP
jgi:hypothetical protein